MATLSPQLWVLRRAVAAPIAPLLLAAALSMAAASQLFADEPKQEPAADRKVQFRSWAGRAVGPLWPLFEVIDEHHIAPPARVDMWGPGLLFMDESTERDLPKGSPDWMRNAGDSSRIESARRQWNSGRRGGITSDAAARLGAAKTPEDASIILAEHLAGRMYRCPSENTAGSFRKAVLAAAGCKLESIGEHRITEAIQANHLVGIGIGPSFEASDGVLVAYVIKGSPAAAAGLQARDTIVSIDGVDVRGRAAASVLPLLAGEEGSEVKIGVRRLGEPEVLVIPVVRRLMPLPTVSATELSARDRDLGITRVDISAFRATTVEELRELEATLVKNQSKILVLDFRFGHISDRPDDPLQNGLLAADGLLTKGQLAATADRAGRERNWQADDKAILRDVPIVLILGADVDPARGAFISALQFNARAKVIGRPVPCKCLLTEPIELPDKAHVLNVPTRRLLPLRLAPQAGAGNLGKTGDSFTITPDEPVDVSYFSTNDFWNPALQHAFEAITKPKEGRPP